MVYFAALVIFALITTVTWFVAIAIYQQLVGGPDLHQSPGFSEISSGTILLVTLFSFIPFPAGYLFSLGIWWLAARNYLELPAGRAVTLFVILAALSMVARLAVLGVLSF